MRCPKCGANVPDGKSKCPYCFSPISDQPSRSFSVASNNNVSNNANEMIAPKKSSADIYEKNVPSIAIITFLGDDPVKKHNYQFNGSGWLISRDGYLVTNTHVVYNRYADEVADEVDVLLDGKTYKGRVLRTLEPPCECLEYSYSDVALVKIDARFPSCLRVGNSDNLRNGEEVTAIGNALGFGYNVTRGVISDVHKKLGPEFGNETLLVSDVGINGGNSGGPLFNSRGEVIAMCVSAPSQEVEHEAFNFFIPVNHILEILRGWGYKF